MARHYTVTRLARELGISRTTLLHYERLGLVVPATRSAAGYRCYGEREAARLAQVCAYRAAGLSLASIRCLLDGSMSAQAEVFRARLDEINREIGRLREQQVLLVRLLGSGAVDEPVRVMDKARWVAMLRAAGADEAMMARWHAVFEARTPEAHQDFLESLGLGADEIREIRAWSRSSARTE